jgi:FKBP-type peptidyl-prolyl cis-trans isomerase
VNNKMIKILSQAVILGLGLGAMQANAKEAATSLKTDQDKLSYSIGVDMARNFKRQEIEVDADVLARGFKDAYQGSKLDLTDPEMQKLTSDYQVKLKEKQMGAMKKAGETNQKEGEAFLAANAKKEGVITLPSGLQYLVLKKGDGPIPKAEDTVKCNYRGTLINGTEFDSSFKTGKPATFPVGGVIAGWTEALKMMPVGSKWQLFIPSKLAYGPRGAGRDIGPNATLIFEIELLGIEPAAAKPAAP